MDERTAKQIADEAGQWTLSPSEGGQIVQSSWGYHDAGYVVERRVDRSDGRLELRVYADSDVDEWGLWATEPAHGDLLGEAIIAAAASREEAR